MERSINCTPTGYTTYLPSADKIFSRFSASVNVFLCFTFANYILSPEGRCVAYPDGFQLILLSIYCLSERIWDFKNLSSIRIFFSHQQVLSPEGRCLAYPVGVQLFLLMFYFELGNELRKKRSPKYCDFLWAFSSKCFLMGRVGRVGRIGRVGRVGR